MAEEFEPVGKIPKTGLSVIRAIGELHDTMEEFGHQLSSNLQPLKVLMVGSKSSGKSSVLDALMGRPIRLMLEHRQRTSSDDGREWAEFNHLPGKRFYSSSRVREEIQIRLEITERYLDVYNFFFERVPSLNYGSYGIVNWSLKDVSKNWNIQEAFATEESFFIEHPVYSKLANHCGIPQLAKKLNQILELHIRNVHPGLKAKLNYHMVTLAGELQAYRKVIDSKEEQREVLLNILDRYCQDFCAMIDGSNQNMSTRQLYDSRIHYVFESIFGTTLEELDPCENLADENIQKTIRNVTGIKPASLLFTVLFEVLARK